MQQKFLPPRSMDKFLFVQLCCTSCTTFCTICEFVHVNVDSAEKFCCIFCAMKYFCLRIIFFCLLIDSNLYIRNIKCKTNVSSADDKEGMYYENK